MRDVLTLPNCREHWEWGCSRRDTSTGRHCAFSSRAQTPSFRVTLSLTSWGSRQDSGPGSIRVQSGVAGCGPGDEMLCPLFIAASRRPPISPSNQLTHNNMAKDLLLLSLLSQVTCSAPVLGQTAEGKCVYEQDEDMPGYGFNPPSQGGVCC